VESEYFNPIIEAVRTVGCNFLSQDIKSGEPFIKSTTQDLDNLIINIGITGDLKGQCIFSFDERTIKEVVGAMMGGMVIEKIDDMAKSAISEFGNMVMGNAATNFTNFDKHINISSPITIEGNMSVSSQIEFIGLPFCIERDNSFEIYLTVEEGQ